jgi:hypothetical protein
MKPSVFTFATSVILLIGCVGVKKVGPRNSEKPNLEINSDAILVGKDPAPKYPKLPAGKKIDGFVEITFVVDNGSRG